MILPNQMPKTEEEEKKGVDVEIANIELNKIKTDREMEDDYKAPVGTERDVVEDVENNNIGVTERAPDYDDKPAYGDSDRA